MRKRLYGKRLYYTMGELYREKLYYTIRKLYEKKTIWKETIQEGTTQREEYSI